MMNGFTKRTTYLCERDEIRVTFAARAKLGNGVDLESPSSTKLQRNAIKQLLKVISTEVTREWDQFGFKLEDSQTEAAETPSTMATRFDAVAAELNNDKSELHRDFAQRLLSDYQRRCFASDVGMNDALLAEAESLGFDMTKYEGR